MTTKPLQQVEIDTAEFVLERFILDAIQHIEDLKGVRGLTSAQSLHLRCLETGRYFVMFLNQADRNIAKGRSPLSHERVREGYEWLNRFREVFSIAQDPA